MTEMVAVFGTDGSNMGEVFPRRALQLIKRQRAVWADGHKQSIKLLPGVSLDSEEIDGAEGESPASDYQHLTGGTKSLYETARRRIRERRNFIWHTVALLPGYFLAFYFVEAFTYGIKEALILGFLVGVWTTLYVMHVVRFAKPRVITFRRISEEERILREIKRMDI